MTKQEFEESISFDEKLLCKREGISWHTREKTFHETLFTHYFKGGLEVGLWPDCVENFIPSHHSPTIFNPPRAWHPSIKESLQKA